MHFGNVLLPLKGAVTRIPSAGGWGYIPKSAGFLLALAGHILHCYLLGQLIGGGPATPENHREHFYALLLALFVKSVTNCILFLCKYH